jgi:hypothetical protein
MTTLTDDQHTQVIAASPARYFYFYMALACMAVAFLGFAPTYWLPMASGKIPPMPVVHFHGMLFFAWTLYFAFQSWLAASGQITRHRAIGMIGVSLATAMTIFGFLVAVNAMKRSAALGLTDEGIAFAIVPLSGILFFAVVFGLAIANVRRPDRPARPRYPSPSHRRSSPICCWWLRWCSTGGREGVRIRCTPMAAWPWWPSNS